MGRTQARQKDEDFSFVSPFVKYLLFIFNMIFWVSFTPLFTCHVLL